MADDGNKQEIEKYSERLRTVEITLQSHLATCAQSGKGAQASMDTLTEHVQLLEHSVNGLKEEKAETRGILKGWRIGAMFLAGLITVVSIFINIYFVLLR